MRRVSQSGNYRLLLETWAKSLASSAVWEASNGKARLAANAHLSAARAVGSLKASAKTAQAKFTFFDVDWEATSTSELNAQAHLLRDIFGNPFRSAAINPAWLRWNDGAAAAIAQKIYDDRDFSLMPVLADALEEAGCTNGDILDHCRQPGEHVRGCWVVDLVLGKS